MASRETRAAACWSDHLDGPNAYRNGWTRTRVSDGHRQAGYISAHPLQRRTINYDLLQCRFQSTVPVSVERGGKVHSSSVLAELKLNLQGNESNQDRPVERNQRRIALS